MELPCSLIKSRVVDLDVFKIGQPYPYKGKTMSDNPKNDFPDKQCGICSGLSSEEYASQKYGWEQDNTYLPAASGFLIVVRDFQPYGSRKLQLQQCPECSAYYLYRSDYEYLVNGSEDEEFLTRLSDEQAAEYLNRPKPES